MFKTFVFRQRICTGGLVAQGVVHQVCQAGVTTGFACGVYQSSDTLPSSPSTLSNVTGSMVSFTFWPKYAFFRKDTECTRGIEQQQFPITLYAE